MPTTTPDPTEQSEIETFCKRHFTLAQKIAARWGRWFPSLEIDLESDSMFALFRAARTRASWPGEPAHLVHRHCHSACVRLVKRERRRPDSAINAGQPTDDVLATDMLADDGAAPDLVADMTDLLNSLPPKRREAIYNYFAKDQIADSIAIENGVTPQAVQAMIERDLIELRVKASLRKEKGD